MDRLDELAIFVAIADSGSLVGAARRQRLSTSAVTRALARLEDRAGVRLAERTTRRLSLTDAGREFAGRARAVLSDYDEAVHKQAGAPVSGLLRVTAPVPFGRMHVMPLVTGFLDAYPNTQIELVLNDRNLDLIDEGIDVALRIGALADSTLVASKVGEVRRMTVASPDYLRAHGTPHTPADLANHDLIFSQLASIERGWAFGRGRRVAGVRLSPRLRVNDVEGVLFAARGGRGIAQVLSYQVVDDLAAGRLVRILRDYEPAPFPVQLVTPSASHMPSKTRAFLDFAANFLRELPAIRAEQPAPVASPKATGRKA